MDTVGEGEGGMKWKSSSEAYILSYVEQIGSGTLLYDAGSSNLALCDNVEAWDSMGGGREAQEGGDIWISVADPGWCMAETNTIL